MYVRIYVFPVGFLLCRGFRINKSRRKKSGIIPADRTYTHIYSQAGRIKYIIIIHIPSLSLTVIHLAIVPVQLVFPYLYMNPSHMHGCSDILYVRIYVRGASHTCPQSTLARCSSKCRIAFFFRWVLSVNAFLRDLKNAFNASIQS